MSGADLAQSGDQWLEPRTRLGREVFPDTAEVARCCLLVLPRQHSLPQRAVCDDDAALRLRPWHELTLGSAMNQAEQDLIRKNGSAEKALGLLPAGKRVVADADVLHQPFLDQASQARHGRACRKERARPVKLVQVDVVDAEPPHAVPSPPARHERKADRKDLGGEEDAVPPAPDRLADDTLGPPQAVDLGGIDEVHAQLEGATDYRARHFRGVFRAVAPLARTELPRAQPDRGDPNASDLDVLHEAPPASLS